MPQAPVKPSVIYDDDNDPIYDEEQPVHDSPFFPPPPKYSGSTKNKAIELARPHGITAALALGSRAAQATPGPIHLKALMGALVGGGSYLAGDAALQGLEDTDRPTSLNEKIGSSTNQALINAGLTAAGFGADRLLTGGKEYLKPGSQITDEFLGLKPTTGQVMKEKGYDKLGSITDWFTRTFNNRGSIEAKRQESANLGNTKVEDLARAIKDSGNTTNPFMVSLSDVENPRSTAGAVQALARLNESKIKDESNAKAEVARIIALSKPALSPSPAPPTLIGPPVQTHMVNGVPHRIVYGPIPLPESVTRMQAYLQNRQQFWGDLTRAEGSERAAILQAQGLLDKTVNGTAPISFSEAWDAKQEIGKLAFKQEGTRLGGLLGDLYHSLDNDIQKGIKRWPDRGRGGSENQAALEAYKAAKETVLLRHELFDQKNIVDLVDRNNGDPLQVINQAIDNPGKLRKLLDTGEITLPNPSGGRGGPLSPQKILSTNMRQELGGHEMERILQNNRTESPIKPGTYEVNVEGMRKDFSDPTKQDSYKELWSRQTRDGADQLFKQIAITQDKGTPGRARVYLGHAGLAIPAMLLTGHMTNYGAASIVGGTVSLGGFAMARALQNPRITRALTAMAAGQPPGMSESALGRLIIGSLQGTGAMLSLPTNEGEVKGSIDKDGAFQASGR